MQTPYDNMQTPYDNIPSYYIDRPELFKYLEKSLRTDYIVTIMINGVPTNELLLWDWECDSWVWSNDWYEGENEVSWMGIVAIEDVMTLVPPTGDSSYKGGKIF